VSARSRNSDQRLQSGDDCGRLERTASPLFHPQAIQTRRSHGNDSGYLARKRSEIPFKSDFADRDAAEVGNSGRLASVACSSRAAFERPAEFRFEADLEFVHFRFVRRGFRHEADYILGYAVAFHSLQDADERFGVDTPVFHSAAAGHLSERCELVHTEEISRPRTGNVPLVVRGYRKAGMPRSSAWLPRSSGTVVVAPIPSENMTNKRDTFSDDARSFRTPIPASIGHPRDSAE